MTGEPASNIVRAVNVALDEDNARVWFRQWKASAPDDRTQLEADVMVAALIRNRSDPLRRVEQHEFERLVQGMEPR